MKRNGLVLVSALMFSAAVFAQNANSSEKVAAKWDGSINKEKLNKYLKLSVSQDEKVSDICDFFKVQMKAANRSEADNNVKIRSAVYSNLKLMKQTLDEKQYSEYARLMALTMKNKGIDVNE